MIDYITDRIPTDYSMALVSIDPLCQESLNQFEYWISSQHIEQATPEETQAAWRIWVRAYVGGYITGSNRMHQRYSGHS